MSKTFIVAALLALSTAAPGAGTADSEEHAHLNNVACIDVPAGQERPAYGCFNVATVRGLSFQATEVYWHLRNYESVDAANAAKSRTGVVTVEDGKVWLSEFGAKDAAPKGGTPVAVMGPMKLPPAKIYTAVLSYAVMRPGDSSRIHTHAGPEAWYVITGEQCLETPAGALRLKAGQGGGAVESDIPMMLHVTGTTIRHAFALVIHDESRPRGSPSDWKPPGACQ